ncbi:motile sperm domain-containing protein 2 [Apis mellifera caucasica]|uniref:Motile sperm domain-containing protein 2 n=3 Tax=Apis TaxID=7459 RepID=A0A7M7TEZ2_APIME|nr:motile sperm domain-containing protein 2 [Apis mellifera]KAG6797794.1 motile sperm domain-containing protein 2 [Apis mellifera caucasica]KAG9437647.1 motile sperm domain-containing protein 2 [Apis mellifera carnica]|eukprot:XP_393236.2 motile sperm domain-containing protein 2 [Apis mellifera]
MEVRTELISHLREKFFKKLDDEGPPDPKFHPADIARVKENNNWLRRFLEHNENNIQESLNMLWDTCIWRSKFGTNEITEENVRKDYLDIGLCFIHGKDKDGKTMFVIKCSLHTKGSKEFNQLQKLVVYWFERLERLTNGNQISLFFDMSDTGILNMDMEFIKYLINLCKSYYPNFLNYIIIFEMPWILNTAFKIIKSWLPPKAIPKIKFVHKGNIHELVDPNDVLTCWGGSNEYLFKFVSEAQNNIDTTMNGKFDSRKVHFAEGSPLTEQSPGGFGEQSTEDQLLSIEPDAVIFNKSGNEIGGSILLKNVTSDKPLSYKVKTTSPGKFRVRPSSGILLPQEQRSISVVVQQEHNVRALLHVDKFLVMCLPLKDPNTSAQELAALWKSEKPAEEHKLKCCYGGIMNNEVLKLNSISGISENSQIDTLSRKIAHLKESNTKMHSEVVFLKHLLLLSMIVTITVAIIIVYILKIDIKNSMDQHSRMDQACDIHHEI